MDILPLSKRTWFKELTVVLWEENNETLLKSNLEEVGRLAFTYLTKVPRLPFPDIERLSAEFKDKVNWYAHFLYDDFYDDLTAQGKTDFWVTMWGRHVDRLKQEKT